MAKKLFALEDADVMENEMIEGDEVAEISDAQMEVADDEEELEDITEGVDEGIDAANQLEEVEEVVEKAAEGEGLDEAAVECLRIAVEAIGSRVGYPVQSDRSLRVMYAAESFSAPSSRVANTKIALEGIKETLKKWWEAIKKAVKNAIAKLKELWDKYIYGFEKTKRGLRSLREKLNKMDAEIKIEKIEKGVDSLAAFFRTNEISEKNISTKIKMLEDYIKATDNYADTIIAAAKHLQNEKTKLPKDGEEFKIPVGKYNIKVETEDNDFRVSKIKAEFDVKAPFLMPAGKTKLASLLDKAIDLIDIGAKGKKQVDALEKSFEDTSKEVEKEINEVDDDELRTDVRESMKIIQKAFNAVIKIMNMRLAVILPTAKMVALYVKKCMSQTV